MKHKVVSESGPPCPRCHHPLQVREHGHVSNKMKDDGCYYARWYYCNNVDCNASTVMPREFAIYKNRLEPNEEDRATCEGWWIADEGETYSGKREIHRIDHPLDLDPEYRFDIGMKLTKPAFEDDQAALRFVIDKAAGGSPMHFKALTIIRHGLKERA